jgi:uncharacterized protein YecE (DUF72 family)
VSVPVDAIDGIRVGIGGWDFKPWRTDFYPQGLVHRRELEYASRHISSIEINSTYYRPQTPATYARWRDDTPDGFMFSAKAPMRIMQSRALSKTGPQVQDFIGGIAELGEKLGPLLWQFDGGPALRHQAFAEFCALLPPQANGRTLRHVIDMRDRGVVDAAFIKLVRHHGFATVCTDSPDYPSFADVTADFAYARLMRSRSDIASGYTIGELKACATPPPTHVVPVAGSPAANPALRLARSNSSSGPPCPSLRTRTLRNRRLRTWPGWHRRPSRAARHR